MADIPQSYYDNLARIESNNDLYARATTSTASGLYQFIRSTWESLGGEWGTQSGVAFGGLRPSEQEQRTRVAALTTQNANTLSNAGLPVNDATLYAAHFLGPTGARNILRANPNTPIEQVTTREQRTANPSILRGTVGDFFDWLKGKTGTDVTTVTGASNSAPMFTPPFTDASDFGLSLPQSLTGLAGLAGLAGTSFESMRDLAAQGNIASGIGDIIDGAGEAIQEITPLSGFLDFFRTLFSQETAIRFIVVLIGLVALTAAFVSLVIPPATKMLKEIS